MNENICPYLTQWWPSLLTNVFLWRPQRIDSYKWHCSDVIMSVMASDITSALSACSSVCSDADQRKHQRSASLAFVRGIPPWLVDSSYQGLVTRKMFPLDDVVVNCCWNVVMFASCAILGNNINIMAYTIPISWFIFKSDISMYNFLLTNMLGVYTIRETHVYFYSVCIDLMPMTF